MDCSFLQKDDIKSVLEKNYPIKIMVGGRCRASRVTSISLIQGNNYTSFAFYSLTDGTGFDLGKHALGIVLSRESLCD